MRVLGIDPGFATTGYAVVERRGGRLGALELGAVRTSPGRAQAERLLELHEALAAIIRATRPEFVALERVFFNANVRTAMAVGQASGVSLLAAAASGLEVCDYTPPEVKQAVAGVGTASKKQIQAMVASLLNLPSPPDPPDVADACAVAICHINRSGLARAIEAASS